MALKLPESMQDARYARSDVPRLIAEVKRLTASSSVVEARRLLADLLRVAPDDPEVARWNKILGRPRIHSAPRAAPRTDPRIYDDWFKNEAERHAGEWVALRDGKLVGSDRDRVKLHRELEARGELTGTLFVPICSDFAGP
jgi:Family of unknown function (DUF5678)